MPRKFHGFFNLGPGLKDQINVAHATEGMKIQGVELVHEKGLPLEAALAWTVRTVGLEYEVRGNQVFVSTPDKLKR